MVLSLPNRHSQTPIPGRVATASRPFSLPAPIGPSLALVNHASCRHHAPPSVFLGSSLVSTGLSEMKGESCLSYSCMMASVLVVM